MTDGNAATPLPILLVGGGRMGSALLHGWLDRGYDAAAITVVEPDPSDDLSALVHEGLSLVSDADGLADDIAPAVTVLAVKPQILGALLDGYAPLTKTKTVFLSIAAGITVDRLTNALGRRAAIVRSMPNTPAAVGSGITVMTANKRVSKAQRELCQKLLSAVGETAWIDDEQLMDAVTAVSGSGPAYVFLMVEALAEAGVDAGLDPELADRLARATVIGSGDLLRQARETAAELRQNVTSPGGTTQAALEILMADDGLSELFGRAVARAAARSRELAES